MRNRCGELKFERSNQNLRDYTQHATHDYKDCI